MVAFTPDFIRCDPPNVGSIADVAGRESLSFFFLL